MKKLVTILILCLTFVFCSMVFVACGSDEQKPTESEYFIFTLLDDDTYEIKARDVHNVPANVVLPSTYKGKAVTSIGEKAFYWSRLVSITIPENVTNIGNRAFSGCKNLTTLTIPASVTSISVSAFESCSRLTDITVASGNAKYYVESACLIERPTHTLILGYKDSIPSEDGVITTIGDYAFSGRNRLTNITIPESVTSIGNYAFSDCYSLTDIVIPNSVTSIGDYAFLDCYSLTNIIIPNSVISIGDGAFCCSGLTNIDIGNGVKSIGSFAFSNCSGLTSIRIPDSVTWVGGGAFFGCGQLQETENGLIYVDNVLVGIESTSEFPQSYTVREGTIIIAYGAFTGNSDVETINLPTSLKSISSFAFEHCNNLTNIIIPEGVTSVGSYAFMGCISLSAITIPKSVMCIEEWTFAKCSHLNKITIPDSVTTIGNLAFYNCIDLTHITIPDSVIYIEDLAFYDCWALTGVYYKGAANEWNNISIGCDNNKLTDATWYYYSETAPTTAGNYWHYDTDGVTPVVW